VQHTRLRDHQTGQVDYTVTSAATTDPWFANTGFHPGDVIKDVVGNEWDGIPTWLPPECNKPGLVVLFHYEGPPQNADAVRYTAPSGARVFASGAQQFSWGLDTFDTRRFGHSTPADPRLQQFMRNALDDLLRPASPQRYRLRVGHHSVHIHYAPPQDPRIRGILVFRHDGSSAFSPGEPEVVRVCFSTDGRCRDTVPLNGRTVRYAAVAVDEWGESAPLVTEPLRLVPGTRLRTP
jgi:hypothetical protein